MNSSISFSREVAHGALDQAGAVVGRDDLHARGQAGLRVLASFAFTASMVSSAFLPERMTMMPPRDFALAVQFRDAAAHLRADLDARDVAQPHRHAGIGRRQRESCGSRRATADSRDARTMYSASPSSSTEPPVSWLALLHRLDDRRRAGCCRRAAGPGSSTIWYCRTMPPTRRDFRYVRHGLQFVLEEPVLQRAQLATGRACRCGRPARIRRPSRRRSRPARAPASRSRRQPRLHLVQVLEHARARPVQVGAVLEQDVDEGIAEERIAAHRLGARHRQHGRGQRIGDLVLDDLRRLARIRRADDHLHVGQVGHRVERRRGPPPTAPQAVTISVPSSTRKRLSIDQRMMRAITASPRSRARARRADPRASPSVRRRAPRGVRRLAPRRARCRVR